MPWQKGNPGKPKGANAHRNEQWENFSRFILTKGIAHLEEEMMKLEGKEYVKAVCDIMEYFRPKLARVDHGNADDEPFKVEFTDEQATKILKIINGK